MKNKVVGYICSRLSHPYESGNQDIAEKLFIKNRYMYQEPSPKPEYTTYK